MEKTLIILILLLIVFWASCFFYEVNKNPKRKKKRRKTAPIVHHEPALPYRRHKPPPPVIVRFLGIVRSFNPGESVEFTATHNGTLVHARFDFNLSLISELWKGPESHKRFYFDCVFTKSDGYVVRNVTPEGTNDG